MENKNQIQIINNDNNIEQKEQPENILIPSIMLEFEYLAERYKILWNKETVLMLIGDILVERGLIKQVGKKMACVLSPEEIEEITKNILLTIFNPQAIEGIIVELASKLIDVTLDLKQKNPKIIIAK